MELTLRPANMSDLPHIKKIFSAIVEDMYAHNLRIWDDIFPCEFFEGDIERNELWLLTSGDDIIPAFMLSEQHDDVSHMGWSASDKKAVYFGRFGVNLDYRRQGIATRALDHAKKLAQEQGAEYLRLFVVDENKPAITLYEKYGFQRVDGILTEEFEDGGSITEYGYELKL